MIISPNKIKAARILIVDDQLANVELLEQMMREDGYTDISFTLDPRAAGPLHCAQHFDLILLDLLMPEMDGFAVMAALSAAGDDPYLPVIVLTADPSLKLRALQSGAKDFISKPFDLVEVKSRIHNMLEVRLLYRRLDDHNRLLEQQVHERTAALADSEERFRRLTELASDWYWEQNETGRFTRVSGPVEEMLGIRVTDFLCVPTTVSTNGWDEAERAELQTKISARMPFLDFHFSRRNPDGSQQHYRVSGEPMFDASCSYTGYRGIGAEIIDRT